MVWVHRCVTDIESDLLSKDSSHRPLYPGGLTLQDVYSKRQPFFERCSTHDFFILPGDHNWPNISADFTAFLSRVLTVPGNDAIPSAISAAAGACFLCFTHPDVFALDDPATYVRKISSGVDLIELRVDLFGDVSEGMQVLLPRVPPCELLTPRACADSVLAHIALFRRSLPHHRLMLTLRSALEGGSACVCVWWSLPCFIQQWLQLLFAVLVAESSTSAEVTSRILSTALRSCVEFVDVELAWTPHFIDALSTLRSKLSPCTRCDSELLSAVFLCFHSPVGLAVSSSRSTSWTPRLTQSVRCWTTYFPWRR